MIANYATFTASYTLPADVENDLRAYHFRAEAERCGDRVYVTVYAHEEGYPEFTLCGGTNTTELRKALDYCDRLRRVRGLTARLARKMVGPLAAEAEVYREYRAQAMAARDARLLAGAAW